jgi:predicted RNase H-like HicB family nuclease
MASRRIEFTWSAGRGDQQATDRRAHLGPVASCSQRATGRQVLIRPGEDGYGAAECPSLPGCVSQGTTRKEAIQNIKEAVEGYTLALQEDGLPVPG